MTRFLLLLTTVCWLAQIEIVRAESVPIACKPGLAPPAEHALSELQRAIQSRGLTPTITNKLTNGAAIGFAVGTPSDRFIAQLIERYELKLSDKPESLLIAKLPTDAPASIVIAGSDERGLAYAIYEVARAIEVGPRNKPLLDLISAARESPFLRTRKVQVQIFNEDLEREWYFDEDYWHGYFSMLAANRYNGFTLTFGHQTNYMNPVYAWLVRVPEYPNVRVSGLTDAQRKRNLRMLNRISRLAAEHGIDFTLGVWTQQPVEKYGRQYLENFPKGTEAGDYCARGLAQVLNACPLIKAVQFRMNVEAGISEDQQNEYFRQQFQGVLMCPRPVKMDLRFKGLRPQTITDAVATGRDVTVSTKFWCEHMGLPFHPTIEDDRYRESRYGYGAMLYKPRDYRVVYRLWSVGSQRLLLWGDPTYAARFARSCTLGGGEGFEIFAPLSNKGFGNNPGQWSILADGKHKHFRHEYERYWHFYQVFGRAGYNPDVPRDVFRREFRARFAANAEALENAFLSAGKVIPLLTATKLFGASEWRFWPEMSTGGLLDGYRRIQPSDYGQFYAIDRWQPVPEWLAEPWESKHSSFVEDALANRVQGKWTPIQLAAELNSLAERTERSLKNIQAAGDSKVSRRNKAHAAETELTRNDLRIVSQLARYHAAKTLAATQLAFYDRTHEPGRVKQALAHIRRAESAWKAIVDLTDGVYSDNLVFGYSESRAPNVNGVIRAHTGHWKDRLPEIRRDVTHVEKLLEAARSNSDKIKVLPGEVTPPAIQQITIKHQRLNGVMVGKPLEIETQVRSKAPIREVILHHRRMDQTVDWKQISMSPRQGQTFAAAIPATEFTARFDHLYYIEVRIAGGGKLWPDWQEETPYVVVKTRRAKATQ